MGSVGNTKYENISSFLDRAIGDNDKIRIESNDMESLSGTKAEVINSSRFKKYFSDMYFLRFKIEGNTVIIEGTTQSSKVDSYRRR